MFEIDQILSVLSFKKEIKLKSVFIYKKLSFRQKNLRTKKVRCHCRKCPCPFFYPFNGITRGLSNKLFLSINWFQSVLFKTPNENISRNPIENYFELLMESRVLAFLTNCPFLSTDSPHDIQSVLPALYNITLYNIKIQIAIHLVKSNKNWLKNQKKIRKSNQK